jgi:hypothetical protein
MRRLTEPTFSLYHRKHERTWGTSYVATIVVVTTGGDGSPVALSGTRPSTPVTVMRSELKFFDAVGCKSFPDASLSFHSRFLTEILYCRPQPAYRET